MILVPLIDAIRVGSFEQKDAAMLAEFGEIRRTSFNGAS